MPLLKKKKHTNYDDPFNVSVCKTNSARGVVTHPGNCPPAAGV
jgi:hypothetical protein